MLFAFVFSIIAGFVGIWYFLYFKDNHPIRKVPSPRVWPIIGVALEFMKGVAYLEVFDRLYKEYNTKTIRLHIGLRSALQTKDYRFLEYLLSSNVLISKGWTYTFLHKWLGLGLLTSTGDKWRVHRKMITPTFHFKILEQFIEVFNSNGKIMIETLKKEIGSKNVDIFPIVNLCALDIICETAMGTSVNAQSENESIYAHAVKDMEHILNQRIIKPIYHYNFIFRFTKLGQREAAALKVLHGYTNSVIAKRRAGLSNSTKKSENVNDDFGQKKRTAFLDMLLQANINGKPLTDEDIREEVDTFMFEGHDTTSAGISYTLYALANHPEVQERAMEELRDIFGDDIERECSYEDLHAMKYLDMVIKETMRLYPPVPLIARSVSEDVEYDGMVLKKGLTIGINAYALQRDPDFYPNPLKFDPDRFDPQNHLGKQPYAYIPFSAGPRNCIGQKFAMLEMKSTVSKVLRHFDLKPASPTHHLQLAAKGILTSMTGVKIGIEQRKY